MNLRTYEPLNLKTYERMNFNFFFNKKHPRKFFRFPEGINAWIGSYLMKGDPNAAWAKEIKAVANQIIE